MKNYTITVNGNVYNVTVEEGTSAAPAAAAAPAAPAAPVKVAPAKKAAPAGKKGAVTVVAPMPGKILGVKAAVGEQVKSGQVILVLEAMKMENEIVAPQDGTIVSIDTAAGASVEAGAVLATME